MASMAEILKIAQGELGVKEMPSGSNRVKYNTWYYGREVAGPAYPWCMTFVQWVFQQADAAALLPARTASCGALLRAALPAGLWVKTGFQPGDIVIYDFTGGADTDHTGIVERVSGENVITLEGNTALENDANGGAVMRRTRSVKLIVGAVRPRYEEERPLEQMDNTPAAYAAAAVDWARQAGVLLGDSAGDLKLHDAVTREQLLVFLYRALGQKAGEDKKQMP